MNRIKSLLLLLLLVDVGLAQKPSMHDAVAPKPLFRDPVFDGAADPVVIWNPTERKWFMFYTNRRAKMPESEIDGVSWVHGTKIGIAESTTGAEWTYRGTANIEFGGKDATLWAPEVIHGNGEYHMYLTVVPGIFRDWSHPRSIVHLTSPDLVNWKYESTLKLANEKVIDAGVMQLADGTYRLWYNNEPDGKSIYYADSKDLYHWEDKGKVLMAGKQSGEGPQVFFWHNSYFMVVDVWDGLAIYQSSDALNWTRQKQNLLQQPGHGADDGVKGQHPYVLVNDGKAYIFYFTHPGRIAGNENNGYEQRRSSLQVAELKLEEGVITCNRDAAVSLNLIPLDAPRDQKVTLSVNVDKPAHAISPRLYGIFLEDINFGGDGGLNAELVKNGGFEFPESLMGWRKLGESGMVSIENKAPRRGTNPHYLSINSTTDQGIANEGFRGIGLHQGEKYHFSSWARTAADSPERLIVRLVGDNDQTLAESEIVVNGSEWQDIATILTPNRMAPRARLEIVLPEPGSVDLDMVSLSPEKTWQNRPRGLRKDLVQWLADLKPAFFRFPGGCIVEGKDLGNRYQWKQTLGDVADRPLMLNRWNNEFGHRLTPDYFQSFTLGFYEYFLMSEEIGAEPLPILNCGMACQFNTGELVPLEELQPYVQDALDLIEFANGPTTSTWGAKRAAMGHPKPFNMKLLGVGNEQWGHQYIERYKVFAAAIKEKYPKIELISSAGPAPADNSYNYAWPELRALGADIVDEHCYAMPDWFLRSANRYDGFERNGPKVCMGEYAAHSVDVTSPINENNLRCALAEAAFMTGMERNSDVVVMSAYAPLLGHEDAWQWRPNLIWFDNLQSYGTPSYYVQQLFSHHRGDEVLPLEITDSRPALEPGGRIGLATNNTSVEFKDILVAKGNEILFQSNEWNDLAKAKNIRGDWSINGGTIRQGNPHGGGKLLIGDPKWSNTTITMKARKLAGNEGFVILFRNSAGGSLLEWIVGGWGNKEHGIKAHLASHYANVVDITRTPGSIEEGRWYDVKIELNGAQVKCYLDGKLIHNIDIPAPTLARVYGTASHDQKTGEVILKVVNVDDNEARTIIKLLGNPTTEWQAKAIVLTGSPEDVNSLTEPAKVQPVEKPAETFSADQAYTFPAHSVTVLRLSKSP